MITREEIQNFLMEIHPFALSIPRMSEEERKELRESMKSHGYLHTHPVVTFEGKILDGRHRYEMATELGIEFKIEEYQGDDPGGYVLVTNIKGRRNLNPGQIAMAAQAVLEVEQQRARERQITLAGSRPNDLGVDLPQGISPISVTTEIIEFTEDFVQDDLLPINATQEKVEQGRAAEIVADKVGISATLVKQAKAIKTRAPELAEQVISGEKSLTKAYKEMRAAEPKTEKKTKPESQPIEFSPTSRPKHNKQTYRELFTELMAKLTGLVLPMQEVYSPEMLSKIAESDEECEYWLEQLNIAKTALSTYTKAINNLKKKEN